MKTNLNEGPILIYDLWKICWRKERVYQEQTSPLENDSRLPMTSIVILKEVHTYFQRYIFEIHSDNI